MMMMTNECLLFGNDDDEGVSATRLGRLEEIHFGVCKNGTHMLEATFELQVIICLGRGGCGCCCCQPPFSLVPPPRPSCKSNSPDRGCYLSFSEPFEKSINTSSLS